MAVGAVTTANAQSNGRNVHFAGGQGVLAGTLQLPPEDAPPWAVAVFLHGAGPEDRHGNTAQAPIGVWDALGADLAAAGVASLRYDKRGVGESVGDVLGAAVADLAADARGAARFVRRVHETAGLPLYIVGRDEGAILALMLAGDEPAPEGAVLLSPHATPLEDVLRMQAAGVQATVDALPAAERQRLGIPDGYDQRRVTDELIAAVKAAPEDPPTIQLYNQAVPARWFRSHFALDIRALLGAVRCPLLAVGGAKDAQVPAGDAEAVAAGVREAAQGRGATADATAHVVPNLTHVLRRSQGPGTAAEYPTLCGQPIDAELRTMIVDWVSRHRPEEGDAEA